MQPGASAADTARVKAALESYGYQAYESQGDETLVLGAVGKPEHPPDPRVFKVLPGVREVHRVSRPYKLVDRACNPKGTVIDVGGVRFGADLVVIAGPCAVESRDLMLQVAAHVRRGGAQILRGGAFKPRSSPYSFQGLGEEGLRYLREAADSQGMACVTEVVAASDVGLVAEYADMLQVGARNMQNFRLLAALGKCSKPVLLKRGLAATLDELLLAAEYIISGGNPGVVLCERGVRTFSGITRNTLDLSAVPVLRQRTHLPVVIDPSHATGLREFVPAMARAAIAAGADGIMVEVHPDPDQALSDGPQSLTPDAFAALISELRIIAPAVHRRFATRRARLSRELDEPVFARAMVFGVGLVGGSVAQALHETGAVGEVVGVDLPEALPHIRNAGVVEQVIDWDEALQRVGDVDLVVLALPVAEIVAALERLGPVLRPGTVVTDVGSTKADINRAAAAALPASVHFVGGHPMAGGERGGASFADPMLFHDAAWVLCPRPDTPDEVLRRVEALVRSTGAHPETLQASRHDELVAAVSHVPRLVAAALANSAGRLAKDDDTALALAAGGFRDVTRTAASPFSMWRDILLSNQTAIGERLAGFVAALRDIETALGDVTALESQLDEAATHQQRATRLAAAGQAELTVRIEDEPGALAAVTTALAHEKINIRDVRILHVARDEDGVLLLVFADDDERRRAAGALRNAGFSVRERTTDQRQIVTARLSPPRAK